MVEFEGAMEMAEGAEDLQVAKTAAAIGVAEVAAGASDLTRAADAALVAERVQELSEIVGAAGIVDVAEGVDMLMKGENVRAMGAIVSLMSKEELERGLELARLAGELWTVSDVVDMLDMPVLAEFLDERGMRLQEIAVDQLLRYTSTRALAGAIKETGKDIEAMGEQEVAEGVVRMAVSEAAAERSQELSWQAMPWWPGVWTSSSPRKWRGTWRAKLQQPVWPKSLKALRCWALARHGTDGRSAGSARQTLTVLIKNTNDATPPPRLPRPPALGQI